MGGRTLFVAVSSAVVLLVSAPNALAADFTFSDVAPADGSTVHRLADEAVAISMSGPSQAISYPTLVVATSPNIGAAGELNEGILDSHLLCCSSPPWSRTYFTNFNPILPQGTLYWQAVADGGCCGPDRYSQVYSFTLEDVPLAPLQFGSLAPAEGERFDSTDQIEFALHGADAGVSSVRWEVATQPTPGQDGTLAADFTVRFGTMFESDASPGEWSDRLRTDSTLSAGRYYWQAYVSRTDPVSHRTVTLEPVAAARSFDVLPVPELDADEALGYAGTYLNDWGPTGKRSVFLDSCFSLADLVYRCPATFRTGKKSFKGSVRIEVYAEGFKTYWFGAFTGRAATLKCLRKKSFKRCKRLATF